MESPSLRQEDLKALDQTRQRLAQLSRTIASLKGNILQENPLPPWESIQTSAAILSNNMNSIVEHLSRNSDIFNRMVVYPTTNYPGYTQEPLLNQLLQKKLDLSVQSWVDEARAIQDGVTENKEEDMEELWTWAKDWIGQRVATYILEEAGDNYTVEEREQGIENVNRGLRRKLEEEESEDEDEDEEMEGVGVEVTTVGTTSSGEVKYGMEELKKNPDAKVRSVDEILRFATSRSLVDQTARNR